MASIKVSDLKTVGISLFRDRESFLNDIKDAELTMVSGGGYSSRTATDPVRTVTMYL